MVRSADHTRLLRNDLGDLHARLDAVARRASDLGEGEVARRLEVAERLVWAAFHAIQGAGGGVRSTQP